MPESHPVEILREVLTEISMGAPVTYHSLFFVLNSFPSLPCLRKYDSLIQDQARELSYLRQKIREGRGICYLLTQHAKDTVKSFEDLLRSNDIDYYLGQSFREQLAQGSQLTERLTSKLSTSKSATGPGDTLVTVRLRPGGGYTSTAAFSSCLQPPLHSPGAMITSGLRGRNGESTAEAHTGLARPR